MFTKYNRYHYSAFPTKRTSLVPVLVADPGSVAFMTPGSGIRIWDMGWKTNPDSYSVSGINISDQISQSLETIFWVKNSKKYLNSLMRMQIPGQDLFDLGSGMEKFGSGINILDPQHW